MASTVMKFKKSPELNLSAVLMKKPISSMKLRPSEGLDLYTFCTNNRIEIVNEASLSNGAPGFLKLLHEEIVNSFGIERGDISNFTTKVILPGVETSVEPSKPTTHSRYLVVLNVPKNKTAKDENGISAEEALFSVLAEEEEDGEKPQKQQLRRQNRSRLSKYPTQKELDESKNSSLQKTKQQQQTQENFKAREVVTFSVGTLSKELLIEEGTIVGLHGIGASSLTFSFTKERRVTLSDSRKTTVSKNPDRRILLVIDAELSMSGAAKMASKLTSMVDKKKTQVLPPGFAELVKTLAPSLESSSS